MECPCPSVCPSTHIYLIYVRDILKTACLIDLFYIALI